MNRAILCVRLRWSWACVALAGAVSIWLPRADVPLQPDPAVKAAYRVPIRAYAFELDRVRLLDGPFRRAMELDRAYLLSLDPDRLLHTFRLNAGLASSAPPLGGWEEPGSEVRGHFTGHYLSACALMYSSTGDERLKEKAARVVAGLAACQEKVGSGYLSAYPEEFIDRVERLERVWAPYYTLHKILAGLLDTYIHCGHAQALEVCRRFADWTLARNERLTDDPMQAMLGNEHGGMNEVLANLYGVTGEEKYLRLSRRFNHLAVIGPASQRVDRLTGLHANTQIPKFIGTARQFEFTGDAALETASRFFWETVVRERSYAIGGHSDGEHFSPKEKLSEALGPSTTETCNTYNMLKLTRHLFCWQPGGEYADYYERALYNHILASQNPEDGMMCYYVPLRSRSRKTYGGPLDAFWCCTGTGIENHAKYGDSIYFHDGRQGLYVNLFIASELSWPERGVTVRQETRFPEEQGTRLIFTCDRPTDLVVHLRQPAWCRSGFLVKINGQPFAAPPTHGYVVLEREWKSGDRVEVALPFALAVEGFRDNPKRFAFLHGPLVLAGEVQPGKPFPAVVAEGDNWLNRLAPLPGRPSTFRGPAGLFQAPGEDDDAEVVLEPFYRVHGARHYVVYWDRFSPDEWRTHEAEYRAELARQRALEARTVDYVNPGEAQIERDHGLAGERTGAGDFGGRKWRHATDGGWFAYDLRVRPDRAQVLQVTYWGSDGGNRVFDLLVNGTKIATQRLAQNQPDRFFDETYEIPLELTQGRDRVTVRFQAQPGQWAGGIFGCRILLKE